jgi:PAS domain S-box-containing protein
MCPEPVMSLSGKKTILLVEDQSIIAMDEKASLEGYGYSVIIADTGEKAIETAATIPGIDLILMDIKLGRGIDGTQAARAILEARDIPIVFITSHIERNVVEKTEKISSYGYVLKTSPVAVLDSSIKMALRLFTANKKLEAELAVRTRGEEELAARGAIFDEAQKMTHLGHWYWDMVKSELYWSDEVYRIFGLDKSTFCVSAETFEQTIHPDDLASFLAERERLLAAGSDAEIGHRIIRDDGQVRHVVERSKVMRDAAGAPTYMMGTVQDITERKEMEDALCEATWRLECVIEGTNVGTWEWNVQTGETTFNPRWAQIVGYTLDELTPVSIKTWETLVHPDDLVKSETILLQHFEGILPYYSCESRMRHKDGNWVWIHDRGKVITRTADGKPLLMFGTHSDITGRKLAEQEIVALLAEKELILKEVHHRIKNNMSTIASLLSIQAYAMQDPAAIAALDDARSRVKSMMVLYDKLFLSSGAGDVALGYYLPALVDEIVGNFPNRHLVKVVTDIDTVSIDAKRIQPLGLIVNELLTNSMKSAFTGRKTGTIVVSVRLEGGAVFVSVKDDGIGIPATVDFGNSTGFGLQLVQTLAQQLRGTARLERGTGTKVVVEFGL